MNKFNLYQATSQNLWKGRTDSSNKERIHQWIKVVDCNVEDLAEYKKGIAIVGFCCDTGVSRNKGRIGAKEGPNKIRQVLANFAFSAKDNNIKLLDLGNIVCQGNLEESQLALAELIKYIKNFDIFPIVIGGGHETAWGHYQGIAKDEFSIVNFDSHFDLRDLIDDKLGSSGTPFWQIALDRKKQGKKFDYTCIGIQHFANTKSLFEKAKELQTKYILADDIHISGVKNAQNLLHEIISKANKIYVTLCLDVFAASVAPGVSASQALGLYPWQVMPLYLDLIKSKKIFALDIVELAPDFDMDDRTAKLAASFIYYFLINYYSL